MTQRSFWIIWASMSSTSAVEAEEAHMCSRSRRVIPGACDAATVVVGGAPIEEADLSGMIELNREAWYAAHESWDALYALIAPIRDQMLVDPLAGTRAVMEAAPESDKAVMNDPEWQRVLGRVRDRGPSPGRRRVGGRRAWRWSCRGTSTPPA